MKTPKPASTSEIGQLYMAFQDLVEEVKSGKLRPDEVTRSLEVIRVGRSPIIPIRKTAKSLEILTTVQIGGGSNEQLISELQKALVKGEGAFEMIRHPNFIIEPDPLNIDLVEVTPEDLGFVNKPSSREIFSRQALNIQSKRIFTKHVLDLCPPETGARFRLQYDLPRGEGYVIGMSPSQIKNDSPSVMVVKTNTNGDLRLGTREATKIRWPINTRMLLWLRPLTEVDTHN